MKRFRPEKEMESGNTEVLFGIHPVAETLKAGRRRIHEIRFAQWKPSRRLAEIGEIARSRNIPVKNMNVADLEELCGNRQHQGVTAIVGAFPMTPLEEILGNRSPDRKNPFLLVLDCIVDPRNLGAIVRTAMCAGVDGVILPRDRSASPTPTVSKASAGALEHMRIVQVTNLAQTLKRIKDEGIWVAGLDRSADIVMFESDLNRPLTLVVGGEEKGIRPLVSKSCDYLISIPQHGPVDSLNASVAAGIAIYEVFRQRTQGF